MMKKVATTYATLERARQIQLPSRQLMLQRAPEVQEFWDDNSKLFADAWAEWDEELKNSLTSTVTAPASTSNSDDSSPTKSNAVATAALPTLDSSLYDPKLRQLIETAWQNPTLDTEAAVRALWTEVFPGVFRAQFFNPEKLHILRDYMSRVADAGIPLRPPYGIALNRSGMMLDRRSEGYLASPMFQAFYQDLMDTMMRPVARLLFPDVTGYDTQTFGFSIAWQADKDRQLQPHTDASSVTLNINLNLPGENFDGSAVGFFHPQSGKKDKLYFEPGTALIHHGSVMHVTEPILSGERHNYVLWMYGESGRITRGLGTALSDNFSPKDRWTNPKAPQDDFAPF